MLHQNNIDFTNIVIGLILGVLLVIAAIGLVHIVAAAVKWLI